MWMLHKLPTVPSVILPTFFLAVHRHHQVVIIIVIVALNFLFYYGLFGHCLLLYVCALPIIRCSFCSFLLSTVRIWAVIEYDDDDDDDSVSNDDDDADDDDDDADDDDR